MVTSSIAARFAGSAADSRFATRTGSDSSSVSMIFIPCARRVLPVSVMSTIASTISGTFASVAPNDQTTFTGMPKCVEVPLGDMQELGGDAGAGRDLPRAVGGVFVRDGEHDPRAVSGPALRVGERREDLDVRAGLRDPVLPRDPEVEQSVLDVGGDLLRTEQRDPLDPFIVDPTVVVAVGTAADGEVRRLEQPKRLFLQGALRDHEPEHGREVYVADRG